MSLKEEDRRIIVEMELGKAERTFAEQKLLREVLFGAHWPTDFTMPYFTL
jgi:hypothetical protein